MAKCYILASISNVLQHQMQDVELASDIMLSLKEMFGEQGRFARQETMRQIYKTKMAEGSSVREHCLTMISNLNALDVLCWLYVMTKSVVIALILFLVFCGILLYWV